MSNEELHKKCIELEYDNGKIRSYASQLEDINRKLINVVNDLKSPSSGGGSFYMSLQIAEQVLKEAASLSRL